ncbi:MAG: biotin--[acetyl-CoA-carboxylase] ligase [Chloroflexi bacterium]|nr:biotin--[acetyl-CoA-carboxylase] ligase [Chloroflexota bacterium]
MKDALSRSTIMAGLTTRYIGRAIEHYAEIDSTNTRAVELARAGAPEGTLVLAEVQTAGRGRLGRPWHAPAGSSLLMSLILRPALAPGQAQRVTMVCSLAAVEAIETTTRLRAAIKWPNDLLIHDKKVGGVLTELGAGSGRLDYVVVGMGINVNLDVSTLPELMAPATSLSAELGQSTSRLSLLLALLERIEYHYEWLRRGRSPHEAWRQRLATLGRRVQVTTPGEVWEGVAEDVDADGALLLRTDAGELRRILAGDLTLRGHLPDQHRHPRLP